MAILYTYPPTGETTDKEPWFWRVNYNDGTQLEQFEVSTAGAIFHRSSEIDASKIQTLQLVHATYPVITVAVPAGATPVHFYRHRQEVEEYTDENGELAQRTWHYKIWVIGYRIDKQFWLVYTDEQNNTVYSGDDRLFTYAGRVGT
jgi:hypothetical protein